MNTYYGNIIGTKIKLLTSVEYACNMFSDKLTEFLDINCQYKTIKIKKLDLCKPYIINDIKKLIKEKHKLEKLFYSETDNTEKDIAKRLRNNLNST